MESRIIKIISTQTQDSYEIESSAETLGELKRDLDAHGIDYTGMSFLEGLTKTELKENRSLLPKNVEWKGQRTNNLVFMLTKAHKNIANGAMSRSEVYAYIKENGLGAAIEAKLGQNYTRCKTDDLIAFCSKACPKKVAVKKAAPKKVATKKACAKTPAKKVTIVKKKASFVVTSDEIQDMFRHMV